MVIPMVTVNPVPVVPVVPGSPGIAIVPIWSVVPIRVIAIAVRVAIIAISIGRITKSDSYAPNSH